MEFLQVLAGTPISVYLGIAACGLVIGIGVYFAGTSLHKMIYDMLE